MFKDILDSTEVETALDKLWVEIESRSEAACGNKCHCLDTFDPVCVGDSQLHFNGCYSGCDGFDAAAGTYSNCTLCAAPTGNGTTSTTAAAGRTWCTRR